MSLIHCPECGQQISDKAEKCPHCGLPSSYFSKEKAISNNEDVDYSNISNVLISFDSDYCNLFSAGHYITFLKGNVLHDFIATALTMQVAGKNNHLFVRLGSHDAKYRH